MSRTQKTNGARARSAAKGFVSANKSKSNSRLEPIACPAPATGRERCRKAVPRW
jgi:hypothetical protein